MEPTAFADRSAYQVIDVIEEMVSGTEANWTVRNPIIDLGQARQIDAVLITGPSRWGCSARDLPDTPHKLADWNFSVDAMNGITFELDIPHGRKMATLLMDTAQLERDMLSERVKSGLAAARARGKALGRMKSTRPKSDKLLPKIIEALAVGEAIAGSHVTLASAKTPLRILSKDVVKRMCGIIVDKAQIGYNEFH
ncbi:recombinase family protein [Pelagibius sp. Alg239-R121]|uniref:recombinase family protein n=1 Tax=Pelagibius sp. Alg239-R121 TaxID=2993448 RepID=UPI003460B7DC